MDETAVVSTHCTKPQSLHKAKPYRCASYDQVWAMQWHAYERRLHQRLQQSDALVVKVMEEEPLHWSSSAVVTLPTMDFDSVELEFRLSCPGAFDRGILVGTSSASNPNPSLRLWHLGPHRSRVRVLRGRLRVRPCVSSHRASGKSDLRQRTRTLDHALPPSYRSVTSLLPLWLRIVSELYIRSLADGRDGVGTIALVANLHIQRPDDLRQCSMERQPQPTTAQAATTDEVSGVTWFHLRS